MTGFHNLGLQSESAGCLLFPFAQSCAGTDARTSLVLVSFILDFGVAFEVDFLGFVGNCLDSRARFSPHGPGNRSRRVPLFISLYPVVRVLTHVQIYTFDLVPIVGVRLRGTVTVAIAARDFDSDWTCQCYAGRVVKLGCH